MTKTHLNVRDLHVSCVAHVVNLAMKECLSIVRDILNIVRAVVNSFLSSVKRRDIFTNLAWCLDYRTCYLAYM